MSNKSKIQALEKKIDQLANRISLQKNKERFLEKKRKTTLGKIFIMAGARKFFNGESQPFNFVIGLGGLFYIVEMQDRKLSVLLGACYLMFEKFGKYDETIKYISTIGDNFYADYLREKRLKKQGASGLIKDFGTSKSAKIESLPSAFILLGGTAPSQAGCDENYVFFFANLLLYAFTAR